MSMFRLKRVLKVLVILIAGMIAFFYANSPAKAPVDPSADFPMSTQAPSKSVSNQTERVAAKCEILQTMGFSRCGHSVTRRIEAPAHVIGADFSGVQQYYQLWQIDSFSKDRIAMSREIPLYCPMHIVISVDEAGNVVFCQNVYGDGMAVIRSTDLSAEQFDLDTRETLLLGLGFDSEDEAAKYLEGISENRIEE